MKNKRFIYTIILIFCLSVILILLYSFRLYIHGFSKGAEQNTFNVYFRDRYYDPSSIDCRQVFSLKRISAGAIYGLEREALTSLLNGPTDSEKKRGFYSSINAGAKILSFEISDGVATVDFDRTADKDIEDSCRVFAIRSEITNTLEQFGTVKKVVILIDTKTIGVPNP